MKKKLAAYLADYIDHESHERNQYYPELDLQMIIEQGIEAFESIEDVDIFIMSQIHERSCETCRKCGETICGNDIKNLMCWERG